MLKTLKLTIFLIVCSLTAFNQTSLAQTDNQNAKLESRQAIVDLKKGILLVKLYTDSAKIQALHKHYNKKKADAYKAELALKNTDIIKAFESNYTFSRVAYFYSEDQDLIKLGDLKNVKDAAGKSFDIKSSDSNYFILDSRNVYLESMSVDQKGYSILKKDFTALERPFPYYVRKRDALPFLRRNDEQMVKLLNEALFEFAEKQGIKK